MQGGKATEASASGQWWRGLEARALFVLAVGSAVVLGVAFEASRVAVESFEDRLVEQRARYAGIIATLAQEELEAALARPVLSSDSGEVGVRASTRSNEVYGDLVFELDASARTMRASPPLFGHEELRRHAEKMTSTARAQTLPVVSDGLILTGVGAGVILVKGVRRADGSVARFAGAFLDAAHARSLLASETSALVRAGGVATIVDRNGRTLSDIGRQLPNSAVAHLHDLSTAIQQRRTFVGRCHECHPAADGTTRVDEVLAAAAMPALGLGVVIREPVALALAPVEGLRRALLGGAALVVALLAIVAALAIRSVASKVRALAHSVRRFEDGGGDSRLAASGSDELGTLARAIDRWRTKVETSLATVDRQKVALHQQVDATNRLLRSLLSVAESSLRAATVQEVVDNGLRQLCVALNFSAGSLRVRHDMASYSAQWGDGPASECDPEALVNAKLGHLPGRPLPIRGQERMATLSGPELPVELRDCEQPVVIIELAESQGFVAAAVLSGAAEPSAEAAQRLHNILHHVLLAATARLFSRHERLLRERRRALLRRVLRAQEDERLRLARELHDTVCQDLAALSLHLERLAASAGDEALSGRLEECEESAHGMLEMVRRISHDLRPTVLDTMGFLPGLQWHIERIHRGGVVRAELVVEGQPYVLDDDLALTLYRIVQECLNNVALHAKAAHVCVTVSFGVDEVAVTVEDDGVGFDRRDVLARIPSPGGRGLGLLGIEERATIAGGRCVIDTEPDLGTTVIVRLPSDSGASLREAS